MGTVTNQQFGGWLDRFPGTKDIPFDINRRRLYRVSELYSGYDPKDPSSWKQTFDSKVYLWTQDKEGRERPLKPYEAAAANLHDAAITRALGQFLKRSGRLIVGFMGGHEIHRDQPLFEKIARIARTLQRHRFLIVSGGGPGLMEAANFGAFMAPYNDKHFQRALTCLKCAPSAADQSAWIASAVCVRGALLKTWHQRERPGSESVGIPTWYYGSEPPNLFATHSGKYFFNSVREDGLVSIADCGTIFTQGAAGTVQEIFQGSTLNYYELIRSKPTPMILFGKKFWNGRSDSSDDLPVYPLLKTLSKQGSHHFSNDVVLTDSERDVINFIKKYRKKNHVSRKTHKRSQRFKGRSKAVL